MSDPIIVDAREVLDNLDKLERECPELSLRLRREFGEAGVKEAKVECPKISDNLVSTIRVEVRGNDVYILAGGIWGKYAKKGHKLVFVNYASFVHDGTYRMVAKPFLLKGANAALSDKESMARKVTEDWLNKIL